MQTLSSPPTVLVEEHHEAYYAWKWAIKNNLIPKEQNTLLHIDEHSDMSAPMMNVPIHSINGNLKKRKKFTYEELNIASFIVPAIYEKLFNKVYWIKQRHNKTNTRPVELYVRSYQEEGKRLVTGKISVLKDFVGEDALAEKQAVGYHFFKQHIDNLPRIKNMLLDIDLDYFSCVQDPLKRELRIEITKAEYEAFHSTPYHRMRYFDLGRVEARKRGGRYYYHLNSFNTEYTSPLKVDKSTILKRLDTAAEKLKSTGAKPQFITICRSRFSGYTPHDQWKYIEQELIDRLDAIYGKLQPKHIAEL